MNNRKRALAILDYKDYDRLPIVHFGYWPETLQKWAKEGHISLEDAENWADATPVCKKISDKLGFDFAWFNTFLSFSLLAPAFDQKVLKVNSDGSKECMNHDGVVVLQKDETVSIPSEIAHSLTNRKSWEELYKPKLQFSKKRITKALVNTGLEFLLFDNGGLDFLKDTENRSTPIGLMLGSMLAKACFAYSAISGRTGSSRIF